MKATKLILTIAFFAFSTMVFTQTAIPDQNEPAPYASAEIMFKDAIQKADLVTAMYVQLNPRFLQGPDQEFYTGKVMFNNVLYYITGTKLEWKHFFNRNIIFSLV